MKDFFENKVVRIIAGVLVAIGSLVLIIGGVTVEEIATVPTLVLGVTNAVIALVTLIRGFLIKKD